MIDYCVDCQVEAELCRGRCRSCYDKFRKHPDFRKPFVKTRSRPSFERYLYLSDKNYTIDYMATLMNVSRRGLVDMIGRWKRLGWLDSQM